MTTLHINNQVRKAYLDEVLSALAVGDCRGRLLAAEHLHGLGKEIDTLLSKMPHKSQDHLNLNTTFVSINI